MERNVVSVKVNEAEKTITIEAQVNVPRGIIDEALKPLKEYIDAGFEVIENYPKRPATRYPTFKELEELTTAKGGDIDPKELMDTIRSRYRTGFANLYIEALQVVDALQRKNSSALVGMNLVIGVITGELPDKAVALVNATAANLSLIEFGYFWGLVDKIFMLDTFDKRLLEDTIDTGVNYQLVELPNIEKGLEALANLRRQHESELLEEMKKEEVKNNGNESEFEGK